MPKHDKIHFDSYSHQTRAKHAILKAYLPRYLTALKNQVRYFHYIDGFAGRGVYAGEYPGSPLLALEIIQDVSLTHRTTISLVESSQEYITELGEAVAKHPASRELARPPLVEHGRFEEHIGKILSREIYSSGKSVATFAFVDPCGVEGVRIVDLSRILKLKFGEVLLFFNYDAVNRLVGGMASETFDRAGLNDLFGSQAHVEQLLDDLRAASCPADRETAIRDAFIAALREASGAKYFVPFRFDAAAQERTSHYLVHCASNALAFKIMKHVMTEEGKEEGESYGKLEFLTDSERGKQFRLFRIDIAEQRDKILEHLRSGSCQVKRFSVDWLSKPSDPYSQKMYKKMLLELEQEGRIVVYDKTNSEHRPVEKRMRKSQPTLGNDLWLRIPGR